MPATDKKEWYRLWFDSPYYDILYKYRDQNEADLFIKNLIKSLHPAPGSFMLDLACGKGRHAISLSKAGFNITGIDLSEKSIQAAKKQEAHNLEFYIHDMRKPFMVNYYDYVFNLFTSFGYFDSNRENNAIITNIYNALKPEGIFVLDFVNIEKAAQCLSYFEEKEIDGVQFSVRRSIRNGFLVKDIHVIDGGLQYDFEEKVHMYTPQLLQQTIEKHGFETIKTFGDYNLNPFAPSSSERFIILSKKK